MRLPLNTVLSSCLALLLCACAVPLQKGTKPFNSAQPGQHPPQSDCPVSDLENVPLWNADPKRRKVAELNADPTSPARSGQAATQALSPMVERYLSELGRAQLLNPDQSRREVADLNADKRLDNTQRFRLAALLARDDHGDWERAIKALDGLDDLDPRAQALVDTLKKSLRARFDLRQQTARVLELLERIQQIKALEKDLQQRNELRKTP